MKRGVDLEYRCDCCERSFCYEELLKSFDKNYGELYLCCPHCGGECFPAADENDEDDIAEQAGA